MYSKVSSKNGKRNWPKDLTKEKKRKRNLSKDTNENMWSITNGKREGNGMTPICTEFWLI